MILQNVMIKTGVLTAGMKIRDGFEECVLRNVPRLPFVDKNNRVIGSFSIRGTLTKACLPDILVEYADLIGDSAGCQEVPEEHALRVLELPIDGFIDTKFYSITKDTAVAKIVALMEKHRINYLFVLENGRYLGEVTIESVARRMLELK